jgi:hypothetical protein
MKAAKGRQGSLKVSGEDTGETLGKRRQVVGCVRYNDVDFCYAGLRILHFVYAWRIKPYDGIPGSWLDGAGGWMMNHWEEA